MGQELVRPPPHHRGGQQLSDGPAVVVPCWLALRLVAAHASPLRAPT